MCIRDRCLAQEEVAIYLEIGAKPTLIGIAQTVLDHGSNQDQNQTVFLSSLNPKIDDWQQILNSLKGLYLQGVAIAWLQVRKIYGGKQISLPHYPFQRQRHWFELPRKSDSEIINHNQENQNNSHLHPLLHKLINSPLQQTLFSTSLSPENLSWLQDHQLADCLIFPGTAYLEMALVAGSNYLQTKRLQLQNISFEPVSYTHLTLPTIYSV